MKKKCLVILIIISILCIPTCVYAVTLQQQKSNVETEIKESKDALDNIEKEKDKVLQEVNSLNDEIMKVEAELSELQDKIAELDTTITVKTKELKEKESLLDERLSAAYMSSGNTYLEAFFRGGLFNFISNYELIKQIAEYDNKLIDEVKNEKKELEKSKNELEGSKAKAKDKEKELNDKKTERVAKVERLTQEQKAMQTAIEEKENELAKINIAVKKAAEEAEAAARRAQQEAMANNDGSSSPSPSSSGSMVWPTRLTHRVNSVYAPYGRTDTQGHVGTAHKGLDIFAPEGTPIYSAQEGTVVYVNYAGYGGGWGLYVVVYHGVDSNGKAIYTRYAHGSAIASGIKVGSKVSTDSVIMYAGNTGASEGAHLHFEVCIGSMYNQVNPCSYLGVTNIAGNH